MTNVLITGANRGIGLALAAEYHRRGDQVIGTARRPEEATRLAELTDRIVPLDVTDDDSVAGLARHLEGSPVDLLINNAGILAEDPLDELVAGSVLAQLDVNAVGPLRVVKALAAHLHRSSGARVIALSSVMGSIAENREGGYYGYRASKAALNAIVRSLAHDLAPVPVTAFHPGYVSTRMTNHQGTITPQEAAADLVRVFDRVDRSMSGRFFDRHGEELPW